MILNNLRKLLFSLIAPCAALRRPAIYSSRKIMLKLLHHVFGYRRAFRAVRQHQNGESPEISQCASSQAVERIVRFF